MHQLPGDKDGAHCLGDQCGDGNARDSHMEEEHKGCIQNDVDDTADDQDVERAFLVTCGAKDGGAHVVDQHEEDTRKVDPQIGKGAVHGLCRSIHKTEHEGSCQYPDECKRDSPGCRDGVCIVEACVGCLFLPRPDELGDGYGSPRGKPGEEADHKGDDLS